MPNMIISYRDSPHSQIATYFAVPCRLIVTVQLLFQQNFVFNENPYKKTLSL